MKIVECAGISLLIILLMSCSGQKDKSTEERVIPVKVVEITGSSLVDGQNYVGTVEEMSASSLSFQVMGNVQEILVREGQKVHKGQLLALLNRATLQDTYDASRASLVQAQDAYDRMKTLYENKSLPEIKWVEVQSKLQQAQSMESIARKNLEDASLYAPFDGVIGKRNVEAGENVQPGKPVFTLLDVGTVNIKIAVPEKEIPFIDHRKAAITVAALGGRLFEGMVTEKGITANPVSHTYEARIKLDNRDGALLPGMVCRVRVEDKDRVTTISLPNNVIQLSHTGERYVWYLRDGKAKAVTVRIGELTDNGVQITDGLSEGDLVITDGYQKVSEDMKVKAL
ncbi:efflux RND transporter periplasmic adaptor subunit [Parabacteroides goldsteinii]|uniref:efflux RND transporter periplasmic adaptor subunit n=1 Tax=Parabacteroides goldsteinii TaxID=328812 RepID=UPI00189C4EA0|nr:efflux RND transporter periplasmic adaptor subunit [Parabacteroides goldsteinii]